MGLKQAVGWIGFLIFGGATVLDFYALIYVCKTWEDILLVSGVGIVVVSLTVVSLWLTMGSKSK